MQDGNVVLELKKEEENSFFYKKLCLHQEQKIGRDVIDDDRRETI